MTVTTASTLRIDLQMALLAASVVLVAGCSLTLDVDECSDDGDCEHHGDAWTCSDDNLCQPPEGPESCQSNSDCQESQGDDWTCSDDGFCEPPPEAIACDDAGDCPDGQECNELNLCQEASGLLDAPCELAVGDIEDDNSFLVGVLLPLTGDEAGFGQPLFNAITLAMADFNTVGGIQGRPVGLIACDTQGQNDLALQGAEHLDEIGVEAVVGPDYSDQTLEVANEVTIDAGMTLVSPSATAAEITDLDDDDLVWRTTASDAVQGRALGQLVSYALDERPHYDDLDDGDIPQESSVAILRRNNDPYADGLRAAVTDELSDEITGDDDRFSLHSYANEAAGEVPNYDSVATDVIAESTSDGFGPDVIVIVGAAEAWQLAEFLEDEFPNPPLFVFADAARNPDRSSQAPDSLRGRIWGTAPQNVGELDYQPYTSFRLRYQQNFDGQDPSELQFVPHAFDALYIIGLGAAYGGFSGAGIAAGIGQLSDGETFFPTAVDAQSALAELSAGTSINLQGASGPLNFDEFGDPEPNPTSLWCFEEPGELPEEGVILTPDLDFTPRSCSVETSQHDNDGEQNDGENNDDEDNDGEDNDNDGPCEEDIDCSDEVPDNSIPICNDGDCAFQCENDDVYCPSADRCLDTEDNDEHCGQCDNACGGGEVCDGDQCVDQ